MGGCYGFSHQSPSSQEPRAEKNRRILRRIRRRRDRCGAHGAERRQELSPQPARRRSQRDFLEEQKLEQFYGLEHVAIDTDNFAGEVAKIKAAGIKILEERVLPDGRKVCFFEGPQGVRLEFLEWK